MMWDNMFLWPFMAGFMLIQFIVGLLLLVFMIWMIIDCAKRNFRNNVEKIVWILVIIFGTWVGALVYYIVIRAMNPKGLAKK